ncbi:MAG: DUF1499 domain-containing protein [Gammaproteobacteria bacterium]|nr:DUF1499 domain-containing protein [Gammaproteobacteria bacterium]
MNDRLRDDSRTGRAPWLKALAWLALIAGLAIGAVALAAPVGVWLGLWDFRTGFQLLFSVASPWGDTVAIAAAVTGVVVVLLAAVLRTGNAVKLGVLAFAGALIAWAGHAVPESYRPDESVPPIHDISTDTEDPPQFVDVLPLRADAPNTTEYGGSPDMTPERLAELTREAYPDVTTVTLPVPPEQAFERALAAVEELGWELVAAAPEDGRIEATDTTFWFRFKDDVVIRIRAADGGSEIDARSVSRVGGGDAGTNAARLREFFERLEESG